MRFYRKFRFILIAFDLLFLGILIPLIIASLLFGDEWGGKKSLHFLIVMTFFVSLNTVWNFYFLKIEESFYRNNALKRIWHENLAFHERQKINQQREEIPGQIDTRLNKILTSNLFYFRMMRSSVFIRFLVFSVIFLIFWGIFNFRIRPSLIPSLIIGFLAGEIWQRIVRYRIAAIFEKEFPSGSSERAEAIQHLNENSHAYWFAPELLKTVTNRFDICK